MNLSTSFTQILYAIYGLPVLYNASVSFVLVIDMVTGFFCKWFVAVVIVTLLDVMHRTNNSAKQFYVCLFF